MGGEAGKREVRRELSRLRRYFSRAGLSGREEGRSGKLDLERQGEQGRAATREGSNKGGGSRATEEDCVNGVGPQGISCGLGKREGNLAKEGRGP